MRKALLNNLVVGFLLTILIASCTTSQDVASNNWIQKRKYNKGFHIEKNSKGKADVVKAEETFTAEEIAPVQIETVTPTAVTTSEVAVAETNTNATTDESIVKEKKSWKEKGLVGKMMSKGNQKKAESKEAFAEYRFNKASVNEGAISPLGVDGTSELHKYLKKAILAAIIATVCYIIGVIIYAARVANALNGGSTVGWGIAGVFYILGYVFYVIAVVFFVLWLVDKFSNA